MSDMMMPGCSCKWVLDKLHRGGYAVFGWSRDWV